MQNSVAPRDVIKMQTSRQWPPRQTTHIQDPKQLSLVACSIMQRKKRLDVLSNRPLWQALIMGLRTQRQNEQMKDNLIKHRKLLKTKKLRQQNYNSRAVNKQTSKASRSLRKQFRLIFLTRQRLFLWIPSKKSTTCQPRSLTFTHPRLTMVQCSNVFNLKNNSSHKVSMLFKCNSNNKISRKT